MPAIRFLCLGLLVSCLIAGLARSQTYRFDMGPSGSPIAPGYLPIHPGSLYDPVAGYGWTTPPQIAISRQGVSPQFAMDEHNFPAALVEDSTASGAVGGGGAALPFRFRIDAAPGLYWCFAYLGDLGDPEADVLTPIEGMRILANGIPVAEDVFAQLLLDKASHWKARGGYKRVAFLAEADPAAGLQLEFESTSGAPPSLMGLEILPYVEPPVSFDRAQQRLVVASAFQGDAALTLGVDRMNQHDYDQARTHFTSVSDPKARAWALSWWLGWLTAAEEPVDKGLLFQTRELLEGLALQQPDDPSVLGLLYELRDFEWGELFLRTRSYAYYPNPKSRNGLLENHCASAQFLEQMSGDLLSDAPIAHETQSPFFAKAQYLLARNMYSRNTHFSQQRKIQGQVVSFEKFGLYTLAIFDALWPRLAPGSSAADRLFPKAHEALMLTYRVQQGRPPQGLWYPLADWDGTVPISSQDLQETWWFQKGYVDIAPPTGPSAPWADHQRKYAELLKNAGRWWIEKREIAGALGGGTGDDVEAAALILPRLAVSEGFDDFVEKGFKRVLDTVIEADDFDESQGYVNYVTDSAHGGENASFPLLFYLPLRYGDARYLNQAMHNIRNLDETSSFRQEGENWSGTPNWMPSDGLGRRLFQSFWFSAEQHTTNSNRHDDVPINYRAILGGFPLMDYNDSPRTVEIFEELARTWSDAAMSTAPGHARPKPAGVIPASIQYSDGNFGEPESGGHYQWWSHGQPNSGSLGGYHDVVYAAMYEAYLRSAEPSRANLIRPLHEAVEFVLAHPPDETATAPSAGWISQRIHKAVTSVARRARLDLQAEFGTDLADVGTLVSLYGTDYARYLDLPGGLPGGKPKAGIEATYADAATWLEYFFPLATTTVSYTDRIKLVPRQPNGIQALHGLYAMRTGAPAFGYVPSGPISWTNSEPEHGPLDVALLVDDYRPSDPTIASGDGHIRILARNYDETERRIRMRLWRVLTPGTYEIRAGVDANLDDEIDGPLALHGSHDFGGKGDSVEFALPADVPFVIELHQTSQSATQPPRLDLGLSEDLFFIEEGEYVATVSNLGAVDYGSGASLSVTNASGTESVSIPPLPAPGIPGSTDLSAQTWRHRFSLPATEGEVATLRILYPGDELTKDNNEVSTDFVPEPGVPVGLLTGILMLVALRSSPVGGSPSRAPH